MKFLLKYPSRGRPELFLSQIKLWMDKATGRNEFQWVFSIDKDDETMNTPEFANRIRFALLNRHCEYSINYCEPKGKIHACNAHVNQYLSPEIDILCLVSDDMTPVQDWDLIISETMEKHFPDKDGAIHINDGLQGQNLITFSCLGSKLYRRFGYFYHSDYKSCFGDDEFTRTVYAWKKVVYIPDVIVRHNWVGHTLNDALHQKNHREMYEDHPIFVKRMQQGFPLQSVH